MTQAGPSEPFFGLLNLHSNLVCQSVLLCDGGCEVGGCREPHLLPTGGKPISCEKENLTEAEMNSEYG